MIGLRLDKKKSFGDTRAVMRAEGNAAGKNLAKAGAWIRQSAKRSMRSRKKASAPGTPPSAHRKDERHPLGPMIKDKLFFDVDHQKKSVLIGPEQLGKSDALEMEEHGGTTVRSFPRKRTVRKLKSAAAKASFKRLRAAGRITIPKVERVRRSAQYDARPFMGPAEVRERPKVMGAWKDSI